MVHLISEHKPVYARLCINSHIDCREATIKIANGGEIP